MGVVVYTLVLMGVLLFRLPYGHVLYLINAGLTITISMILGVFLRGLGVGSAALMLGVLQVMITVNLWPDFSFQETRLQLRVDADATNVTALL